MEAYAVLETGGKQVLVKAGDTIEIEKLSVTEGEEVTLDTVCAVSDDHQERPRLAVYRSNANISAQIIDDVKGVTLAAASSYDVLFFLVIVVSECHSFLLECSIS